MDGNAILRFSSGKLGKYMLKMRADGLKWGYDIPYLLTAVMNSHPRSAIKFVADGRTDYVKFSHELTETE